MVGEVAVVTDSWGAWVVARMGGGWAGCVVTGGWVMEGMGGSGEVWW